MVALVGPIADADSVWAAGAVVMRPIALVVFPLSVNHMLPSGPGAIASGTASPGSPALYSVTTPSVVMRPIAGGGPSSTNHTAPSVPSAMFEGGEAPAGRGNSTIACVAGLIRPIIAGGPGPRNHRLPSGP